MAGRKPELAVLTRPEGRNEALAARLHETGWPVLVLPALRLEPTGVVDLPHPGDFDLVVLVSGNAARLYLAALGRAHAGFQWPSTTPAALVGSASAAVLCQQAGWHAQARLIQPAPDAATHDSEALWAQLSASGLAPRRVLIVRGEQGRDWLAQRLRDDGAEVTFLPLYRRRAHPWADADVARLRALHDAGETAAWLLSSAESIAAVRRRLATAGLGDWLSACPTVVTHPRLADLLRQGGADTIRNDGAAGPMVKISLPTEQALFDSFMALR